MRRSRCDDHVSRSERDRAACRDNPARHPLGGFRSDRAPSTEYVWVFLISGAAPPAHFIGGWAGAEGFRQPAMYFPNGGSTLRGISKPGEIVWSRIYVENDELNMDIGRASAVELPREETERRWQATTPAVADHARGALRSLARCIDGPAQEQSHSGRLRHRLGGRRRHVKREGYFALRRWESRSISAADLLRMDKYFRPN